MFDIGFVELMVLILLGIILVLPYWKIFSKAGFSGWLSLLVLVPIVNIIIIFYLAFAEWPSLKNNK